MSAFSAARFSLQRLAALIVLLALPPVVASSQDSADLVMRLSHEGEERGTKRSRPKEHRIHHLAISPDGKYVAGTCSREETIVIWDLSDGSELGRCQHEDGFQVITFTPDNRYLLASSGASVTYWDYRTQKLLHTGPRHSAGYQTLEVTANSRFSVTTYAGKLTVWDLRRSQLLHLCISEKQRINIGKIALSPIGYRFACIVSRRVEGQRRPVYAVQLWETGTGRLIKESPLACDTARDIALLPDRQHAILAIIPRKADGGDGYARQLWMVDILSGKKTRVFQDPGIKSMGVVEVSKDGRFCLSGENQNGDVHLWNVADGKLLKVFRGHTKGVTQVRFSPNGKHALSSSDDGTVRVWRLPAVAVREISNPGVN